MLMTNRRFLLDSFVIYPLIFSLVVLLAPVAGANDVPEPAQALKTGAKMDTETDAKADFKSRAVSVDMIAEISAFYRDFSHQGMRQTWTGDNKEPWRKALYQTSCTNTFPMISGFPVYKQSVAVFEQNMAQFKEQGNLSIVPAAAQLYLDMGNLYYRAFVQSYAFGVTSGINSLQSQFPVPFEDICYEYTSGKIDNPFHMHSEGYTYHQGIDLAELPADVRLQYRFVEQLDLTAGLAFVRSSTPRYGFLGAASLARILVSYEEFKKVESIYLNTYPFLGTDGYVVAFNEIGADFEHTPVDLEQDDWRLLNDVWDLQRRGFYLGMTSVIRRLKAVSPESHEALKKYTKDNLELMQQSAGIELE